MDVGTAAIKDDVVRRMSAPGDPVDTTTGWQSEKGMHWDQYLDAIRNDPNPRNLPHFGDFTNMRDWGTWATEMYAWGRRVRRDILVLERLLIEAKACTANDFFGDPGDPPPPPET